MQLLQLIIKNDTIFENFKTEGFNFNSRCLALVFGIREEFEKNPTMFEEIKKELPNSEVVFSSTSGQIAQTKFLEFYTVITVIQFEKTPFKIFTFNSQEQSLESISKSSSPDFFTNDLNSILLLSEGSFINGTELIQHLVNITDKKVPIFGGMAGDLEKFEKTVVGYNHSPRSGQIVLIGFYGNALKLGFGSNGGWNDFGPEREVTLSDKNVLYKIGDRYALDLYKEYLGKYADQLPGSSLYFPLSMQESRESNSVVRTILSIDEEKKSMTFAGNIPQGSMVRFMKSNSDNLIDASLEAAKKASKNNENPQLGILVSCVGRKIVLADRVEEELEVTQDIFGKNTLICGYYSYGEFSPSLGITSCELHNQTMTITTLSEM